jgi:hypothetical protein
VTGDVSRSLRKHAVRGSVDTPGTGVAVGPSDCCWRVILNEFVATLLWMECIRNV